MMAGLSDRGKFQASVLWHYQGDTSQQAQELAPLATRTHTNDIAVHTGVANHHTVWAPHNCHVRWAWQAATEHASNETWPQGLFGMATARGSGAPSMLDVRHGTSSSSSWPSDMHGSSGTPRCQL